MFYVLLLVIPIALARAQDCHANAAYNCDRGGWIKRDALGGGGTLCDGLVSGAEVLVDKGYAPVVFFDANVGYVLGNHYYSAKTSPVDWCSVSDGPSPSS